ncbi:hypothetical protein VPHK469_0151 [Vibrio phage K469]
MYKRLALFIYYVAHACITVRNFVVSLLKPEFILVGKGRHDLTIYYSERRAHPVLSYMFDDDVVRFRTKRSAKVAMQFAPHCNWKIQRVWR